MQIVLNHTEDVAANTKTFWFKPERSVDYIAGQFIEMYLPHDNPDERGIKHWFTLSSSPSEDLISITTKHAVDRVSTFKQVLFSLNPGDEIKISEPMGDFVLPKDSSIPLVYVVGGIGVTPVRSIVKWLLDTGEKRDIQLIYAAKHLEDVAFTDLFEAYGLAPKIILSDADATWTGQKGTLDATFILDHVGGNHGQLFYISGPEPLTEKLETELHQVGVQKEQLILDFFPGYKLAL